ncbi:hypothetical protein C8R46DRAFT_860102, partial [Mycena filopes]
QDKKYRRAIAKGDILTSDRFSVQDDMNYSASGWQGAAPPPIARDTIKKLYSKNALGPYLQHFYPVHYEVKETFRQERSTIFTDKNGVIFMFRSYRVDFLEECADQVEAAHDILVASDLDSDALRNAYEANPRGDHMPIIIGHQRQSAVKPRLTAWHERHAERVDKFMKLPIVVRIIGLVTSIVTIMFPGVAARFLADAEWHEKRYGIKPMFGLFWNLCLNAWFYNQRRVQCGPHADKKNQIGVCVLLIYVLKKGVNFNHTQRTWLVVWEAGVVVELPPWVLAMYPSALLYHFNIDINADIQFVTTEGNVRPTPANSRPIVDGDECGRGSFVFFNQSTMRQGPATGFDTIKQAKAAGLSGIADVGESAQEAFQR